MYHDSTYPRRTRAMYVQMVTANMESLIRNLHVNSIQVADGINAARINAGLVAPVHELQDLRCVH